MLNRFLFSGKGLLAAGSILVLLAGPSLAVAETQSDEKTEAADAQRGERPKPQVEMVIDGDPVMKLLPRDAIESLDNPVMVPAAEAGEFMRDEEMILGVFDGHQARAYSTWHLDRHEIVNDHLGDMPIAATW